MRKAFLTVVILVSWQLSQAQPKLDTKDTVGFRNKDGIEEVLPSYTGGRQKFFITLGKTLKYPDIPVKFAPSGQVIVSFFIETDGSMSVADTDLTPLSFKRKVPQEIQEQFRRDIVKEIHRTFAAMPPWTPATYGGKPVRVKMKMPLNMLLE
ncbi:hypothetical protein [Spirosoma fluviale]|nr:hypothetical protein [Spirosoma fluviale]